MPLNQRREYKKVLFPILLCMLGMVLLFRCAFGFDWSDEAYYTTLIYRLAQGDALFSEMWELHQLSVIPLLPLAKLFLRLNGQSTTGMILFFRCCFVLFETLCALIGYSLIKKRYGSFPAFAAAGLMLAFTHFGLPNFSYDSMPPLFLFLSFGLLLQEKPWATACAGILYALSVQCYPQLILSLPVLGIFLLMHEKRSNLKRKTCRLFGLGILILCALFFAFLCLNSSPRALIENISYILEDPTHGNTSVLYLFFHYFYVLIKVFEPIIYLAILLTGPMNYLYRKDRDRFERLRPAFLNCILVLSGLSLLWLLAYEIDSASKLNFLAMALLPVLPAALLLERFRFDQSLYLILLGLCFSLSAQLFSNMGIHASSFPTILVTVGTLLYLSGSDLLKGAGADMSGSKRRLVRSTAAILSLAILLSICSWRILAHHREAPLRELSVTLSDGPAKGVRSTPETAKHYDNIYSALRDAAPAKGKILVTSMLPFGYLMTDCLPASHSVWSSPWSERLEAYYALHPDRLPDLILTVTPGVGFSSGDGDLAGLLNYLSDLGKAPVLIAENESCKIYQVQ